MKTLAEYREVVVADFEFTQESGECPDPLCFEAAELKSGRVHSLWRDDLKRRRSVPFDTGPDTLFVAYYAPAELSCFLELGWQHPRNILDLFAEDRAATNGLLPRVKGQHSLIGACTRRNVSVMLGSDKEESRELIIGRTSWSHSEIEHIRHYCRRDVDATTRLLLAMERNQEIVWEYALLRGRYAAAVAAMERVGVPLDTELLTKITENWTGMKHQLVQAIDADFGVYDGTAFKYDRFAAYLQRQGIVWPRTETGRLSLEDQIFRDMAKTYPRLNPLKELRSSLSDMRLSALTVGRDGRNRCMLSPFGGKTGRNQPSNTRFIFGPSVWMRGLIRPPEGYGLAYIDWHAQEIAIASVIFNDERMQRAYATSDVYLGFAKDGGLAPRDATAESHHAVREQCKLLMLALNYGGGDEMLAGRLGVPLSEAVRFKRLHQETYPKFWENAERFIVSAFACRRASSVFGWPLHVRSDDRPQSVLNFPVQASGADMMRTAAIAATEAGLEVNAPIHDAFLLQAPLDRLDQDVACMKAIMERAGKAVTGGMPVFASDKKILFPQRYADKRGVAMWETVLRLLTHNPEVDFATVDLSYSDCSPYHPPTLAPTLSTTHPVQVSKKESRNGTYRAREAAP